MFLFSWRGHAFSPKSYCQFQLPDFLQFVIRRVSGCRAGLQKMEKQEKLGKRVFSEKRLEKLEKYMVFDSVGLEKLDFLGTNKLNDYIYHYYSLLITSDNGWQLN